MKSSCTRKIRMFSMLVVAALSGLVLANPASATGYIAFDIGTLGGPGTYASAINATGQVTGNSDTANGPNHAFVTEANGLGISDLGTFPGGNKSLGFGINASGQVVGESEIGLFGGITPPLSFVTDVNGNGMRKVSEWTWSHATGINASGQVVGYVNNVSQPFHAFITGANGVGVKDLGTLGGHTSVATDINASGQVVGNSDITYNYAKHAFITGPDGRFMGDLGTLGGNNSFASAINDSARS